MIGQTIAHYQITAKLGEGGMGEVYLATDTSLDRQVALKFLPESLQKDPEAHERLIREAKAASRLRHNNILTIYSVESHGGRDFIVMEYVEGRPLTESSRDAHRSIPQILDLAIAVADGLHKAHAAGIIHRDLKPANILIDRDGIPRIVDFGLAKMRGADKLTKAGSTLGTVAYMSPEQAVGEEVDVRSDIFSFGVLLYELITGRTPFQGAHEAAITYAIINEPFEPMSRFKTGVPAELERVVAKALAKSPGERYQSVADMGADLRALQHQVVAAFPTDLGSRRRLRKWTVASVAVIGVAVLAVAAVLLLRPDQSNMVPERKMLAVLPFQNLSPDPEQEYFSDGLTEDLITTLSSVQSLCIVSRSSIMSYKGSSKKAPEIAKELGVQYIVEGSVRRAGDELRINAQLIDAATDAHLWANKYTGTIDDIFDMQDSVTTAIVQGIRVQLTPEESHRVGKRKFDNPLAYEYYLKGKAIMWEGTEPSLRQGLDYLQQGLDIVGRNALIYCGMAFAHIKLVDYGFGQDEDITRAEQYLEAALQLDPELPEAHVGLALINQAFLGHQRNAVAHLKRALDNDPNNRDALWYGEGAYLSCYGRRVEARSFADRYLNVYPLDSTARFIFEWTGHLFSGEFQEALRARQKIAQSDVSDPVSEFLTALTQCYCDSIEGLLLTIERCEKTNPASIVNGIMRAMMTALDKGDMHALQELASDVKRPRLRRPMGSYYLGAILARGGAKAEAFEWLENSIDAGFINYPFMMKDPFLDGIRDDERFEKLIERVKHEWETFDA